MGMKILFIHGLASSGAYKMASSLRILLKPCEVIAPDVPIDPDEALSLLEGICSSENPDLVVGHSMGGFWAQKMRGRRKILVNPDFRMSVLLRALEGEMKYLSPRRDGATSFTITRELAERYALIEKTQFEDLDDEEIALTWALFADKDEMVRQGPLFEKHYPGKGISYPGTHMPDFPQLKKHLVPLVHSIFNNTANMDQTLFSIASRFTLDGRIKDIAPLGNGLINDTFKVTMDGSTDYVLQRINNAVFQDVELLQRNIEAVTSHLRSKGAKTLRFIPTKDNGKTFCCVDGKYWRVSEFLAGTFTYEAVTPEYSRMCGRAFGDFESKLTDIGVELGETIPDFHNIELRVRQLEEAAAADKAGRLADPEVQAILQELRCFADQMCLSERLHREGRLPKRICHCDTKVNNMLFDADGNVLCVIDLDTTMPSYVFSDYGDFLRTAANFVAEDNPEIDKVGFNIEIFKAFTEGYLESAGDFLTPIERENLPYAACLFPYMQAVRFFADYLNGDTYYKTKYPGHNLVRTRNQIALFRSAMSKASEMKAFIESRG